MTKELGVQEKIQDGLQEMAVDMAKGQLRFTMSLLSLEVCRVLLRWSTVVTVVAVVILHNYTCGIVPFFYLLYTPCLVFGPVRTLFSIY